MSERIVLGVDPSLRSTGYGILSVVKRRGQVLGYGVISNPVSLSQSDCLLAIHRGIQAQIEKYHPTEFAIESTIYVQSYRTAIVLGAARGASLLAAAQAGLSIHEYAPRKIKQAVVGRGGAQKHQVGFMIRTLLGLEATPPPDAADALATALTHIQSLRASQAGQPQK
ncbi:MAG: crossover junction endodeoxyribonuclease RuvC [Terrimicrobiaceae bacterium]